MNQFKDLFLGNKPIVYPRIADTQKCLRVSGKHNDLEEVGLDGYHHTMFEMLGNWSLETILKRSYRLGMGAPYAGIAHWSGKDVCQYIYRWSDRKPRSWPWSCGILGKLSSWRQNHSWIKKDNFWEMGDTGPCGPCSEIHVDIRSEEERKNTRQRPGQSGASSGHRDLEPGLYSI